MNGRMEFDEKNDDTCQIELANRSAAWIEVLKKVFVRWCNGKLVTIGVSINGLKELFTSSTNFINLIEIVVGKSVPFSYEKTPKWKIHHFNNIAQSLIYLEDLGVKIVNLDTSGLLAGDEVQTLQLIWSMILHFQVANSNILGMNKSETSIFAIRDKVRTWINAKIGPNIKIQNFSEDWNDGVVLSCLVNAIKPESIPNWNSLDKKNCDINCENALVLAEKVLNIPQLIKGHEMASSNLPEEVLLTYLSQFYTADSITSNNLPPKKHDWLTYEDKLKFSIEGNSSTYSLGSEIKFMLMSNIKLCTDNINIIIVDKDTKTNNKISMSTVNNINYDATFVPIHEGQHIAKLLLENKIIENFSILFNVEKVYGEGYELVGRGVSDNCMMFFPTQFEFVSSVDKTITIDNLMVQITDSQNIYKLKPIRVDSKENNDVFIFQYTPKTYFEHVARVLVNNKEIDVESKKFSPLITPSMCTLLMESSEIIRTGSIARFSIDYKPLVDNPDYFNLTHKEVRHSFNVFGAYASGKLDITPIQDLDIDYECEGIISGKFLCKLAGIYYINATFRDCSILQSPRKIISTNYSFIEIVESVKNVPFVNEIYKFEIKTKDMSDIKPECFKIAFEGFEFILAQVEYEKSKLIGKLIFERSGRYKMKVFFNEELCYMKKDILILPQIYSESFSLYSPLTAFTDIVACIHKRPGVVVESVEIKTLNFKNFNVQTVDKSITQTDTHFNLHKPGSYFFDIYYTADGIQSTLTWPFDIVKAASLPYIQVINLESLVADGIFTNKRYNIEIFIVNANTVESNPKVSCEVIKPKRGTTLINADYMGSNWMRIPLMIKFPGVHELCIMLDEVNLPNYPVKIKTFNKDENEEKNSYYHIESENDLFVGKIINIYTNTEILLPCSLLFKGPAPVDFLLSRQSTCCTHVICVCSLPGVYQLFIQDRGKNINLCKKIFTVKPTPPHYFTGIVLPDEGLVNSMCYIRYLPEIVTVSSLTIKTNYIPIQINESASIVAEMRSITYPNTVLPVLATRVNSNEFQLTFQPQGVGLHIIQVQLLTDKNNVLELKSIGLIVKSATSSTVGEVFPFAIKSVEKAQIYGIDPNGMPLDVIRINDTEYSYYGEVQPHSMIPKQSGIIRVDVAYQKLIQSYNIFFFSNLIPNISCNDIDVLVKYGCVVNTVFTLILQVDNMQELTLLEREVHSTFYAIVLKLTNGKSNSIYAHYYGNGIFLIPLLCSTEGNYKLVLYFGGLKISSAKFKVHPKDYCNIRIYCDKELCEFKPIQALIDCRCATNGIISVNVSGPTDVVFHSQQIIERIVCVTFYPLIKGSYTVDCSIDCKSCSNSPFVLNVNKSVGIYQWPQPYGLNPMVDVTHYFDYPLTLPMCDSERIYRVLFLSDKSFIQATLIDTNDSSSQWLRIHTNMPQYYTFKRVGLNVAEGVIRTDFGILKLLPQPFYVTNVPNFEYEYPNHIRIYDKNKTMDSSTITIKGYDGQNVVKKVSEEINSDDPHHDRILKVLFIPSVFGNHSIKIDDKSSEGVGKHVFRLVIDFPRSIVVYDRAFLCEMSTVNLNEYFFWVDASCYEIADYMPKFLNLIEDNDSNNNVCAKLVNEKKAKKNRFGSINYGNGWYFVTVQVPNLKQYDLQIFYRSYQFDCINFHYEEKLKHVVHVYPKSRFLSGCGYSHAQTFEVLSIGEFLVDARRLNTHDFQLSVENHAQYPVSFYVKPIVKGKYSIHMESNNKQIAGSPYEFTVFDHNSQSKCHVIAFGEHPFENSSWSKTFIPKGIFGGNGFNLVELKYVNEKTLACSLICVQTSHKDSLTAKHVSNNIFEVNMIPKNAGLYLLDMKIKNKIQDMELYAIPFVVQSTQIVRKGHLTKIPLSIPLFKNIDRLSVHNNMQENDSALALDDIEVVIGSDGNYVEIPFVSQQLGVHTVYLDKDKFYKFHVVDGGDGVKNSKISFEIIDQDYVKNNGIRTNKPYKLWFSVSNPSVSWSPTDFQLRVRSLETTSSSSAADFEELILDSQKFSEEILEFSLHFQNDGNHSVELIYRELSLSPSFEVCSDQNDIVRVLHYDYKKAVINEPLQILFDLRRAQTSAFSLMLDSPVYTESINTLLNDDFVVFTCLPRVQGMYSVRYKIGDSDYQDKAYQFYVPNIDTFIHLGNKIIPRHVNLMTSNSVNFLTTELNFLCCDEKTPTRPIKLSRNCQFEGVVLHAESLKILKLLSIEILDSNKVKVSFKCTSPGLYILNIKVYMVEEERSLIAYPIPVVVYETPQFISGFPAVTPVLVSMRSVDSKFTVTSPLGENVTNRTFFDKTFFLENYDGSYATNLVLYSSQPGVYNYYIGLHYQGTITTVDLTNQISFQIKIDDRNGLFRKPGKSKNSYKISCVLDELLCNYPTECGLVCLINNLMNDFSGVVYGIPSDDNIYEIFIVCPYSGCYSFQLVYGNFYTNRYKFFIDDNTTSFQQDHPSALIFLPLICHDNSVHNELKTVFDTKNSTEEPIQMLFDDRFSDPQLFQRLSLCSTPIEKSSITNERIGSDESTQKSEALISTSELSEFFKYIESEQEKSICQINSKRTHTYATYDHTSIDPNTDFVALRKETFQNDHSQIEQSCLRRSKQDSNFQLHSNHVYHLLPPYIVKD